MAESLWDAGKLALSANVSSSSWNPVGGNFRINIGADNVQVARDVCKTITTLGAMYFGYKLLNPLIESAVTRVLGGKRDDQEFQSTVTRELGNEGDDQEVRGIRPGSLQVQLHCFTDERFLEVLADHESGRMKERLQKEFSQIGIKEKELKVVIENMVEVNKTKEVICKRYDTCFTKNITRAARSVLISNDRFSTRFLVQSCFALLL
jgi:hypothetical protein